MLRLDAFLRRRHRLVLAAWVVVVFAAVPFALRQSENLTGGGFSIPGSQSQQVEDAVTRDFPPGTSRAALVVVLVPERAATQRDVDVAVARVANAAGSVEHAELGAAARRAARLAAPRVPLVVPLELDVDEFSAPDVATDLRDALGLNGDGAGAGRVEVHLVGQGALWAGLQDLSKRDLATAEGTGFPLVLAILLAVFGSLAAASLPLVLGAVSVLVTGAAIYGLSTVMEMSIFVTNMASMIGIGVAVDYSFFVLARYREEIARGAGEEAARATAMATSGVAVLFSGLTVVVSLAGLYLVDATAIRSMALGAILVVLVSMLAAATLLPALIRMLGRRAHERGRGFSLLHRAILARRRRRGSTDPLAPPPVPFFARWSERVMRRPVVSIVAAGGLLLALAAPTLALETGNGALRQFPEGDPTRVGAEAAARVAGPGAATPVKVIADADDSRTIAGVLRADREVRDVAAPVGSTDGGARVLISATTRHDGESEEVSRLVDRLRAQLPPGTLVGGSPGTQNDFRATVDGSMWKIVLFVVLLSYVVLMVLLRSVVLPLKAVLMNVLSVGAAYGVLTIVFVWGWFDGFLGFQSPGFVDTLTPPLVLAVVFGLSMDYEVFLLSRIRERFAATRDTRRAVGEGLASSAATITSAALIMVAVFAVFVGTGVPSIKQLGLGNAVAIAVDATLVRLVLVPAAMELLDTWNWYMPRCLGRLLPEVSRERRRPGAATS
jgi:uncharacterized membrane protein YdfJ with MMPL/SSD domain